MLFWLFVGAVLGVAAVFGISLRLRQRLLKSEERVHRLQQEKAIVVHFIGEMGAALGEGLTRRELFQRIAAAALRSTEALSACVYAVTPENRLAGVAVEGLFPPQRRMADGSRGKLATRAKFVEQVLRSETLEMGEGVIGAVAANRRGELIVDGANDPRLIDHGDAALTVRSMVAVPIEFHGELIGVLAVANPVSGEAFSDTDFSLIGSLAEQAGLAVYNNEFLSLQVEKRQMDLDMSVARSVQMMLVPSELPVAPGLDLDLRYIPAKQVGGDLADVVALEGGKIACVVADVSGKGACAAILMAICRTHLRHALRTESSAAGVLKAVNRALVGEVRAEMFITAIVAIFDPLRGEVDLARAGHEAPLHLPPDGADSRGTFVEIEGMALGMVDPDLFDENIVDRMVPLPVGSLFVLYTDGVTGIANDLGKEFSGSRLMDTVRALRKKPARQINDGIFGALARFAGREAQQDDQTLIVIRRTSR